MKIENLTVRYGDTEIFKNLSLNVRDDEITCVLGLSGAGKTTLLKCVANLIKYEGLVERKKVSFVFQEPRLVEGVSVRKNLELVGISKSDIESGLKAVGLDGLGDRYPKTLSGGEKQRVNLLRALCYPSETILLDEPFSSLDIVHKTALIKDFISLWQKDKKPVVFVTHDIDEALAVAGRIIILKDGKVKFDAKVDEDYPREYFANSNMRKELLSVLEN